MRHREKNKTKQNKKTILLLIIKIIFLLYGICVNIFIMNRCISKSYTTSKNTIDRQYAGRGQL